MQKCGHSVSERLYKDGNYFKCRICVKTRSLKYRLNNSQAVKDGQRRYRETNRDKILKSMWKWQIKHKFGLTETQYIALLDSQKACCAICLKPQSCFKQRLAVDHDHKTGIVRGLLCGLCNRQLGFIEKTDWLLSAQIYLKKDLYATAIN